MHARYSVLNDIGMRVLLRKQGTRLYYGGSGRWVVEDLRATDFHSVEEALLLNRREHLVQTEVLIVHSDAQHTKALPVGVRQWITRQWISAGQTGSL